jgi:hypothetical protein
MGFGLVIRFIEHLQNVTTNNYDSLTKLHTPKITVTTAYIKSSQSSLEVARWQLPKADIPLTQGSGRAVAQAVSHWFPTVAARVRVRAARGVCGGQSGTGAGFLRVFQFPLSIIPPISPSS